MSQKSSSRRDHEKPLCPIKVFAGRNTRHPWCYRYARLDLHFGTIHGWWAKYMRVWIIIGLHAVHIVVLSRKNLLL